MTGPGRASGQPSWEQLLTGAHPSFTTLSVRPGRMLAPRHGRDDALDDFLDRLVPPTDRAMGWGEAATWTLVAGGVALLVAPRLGELVR